MLQRWSREDVNHNLGGGRWWRASDVHGPDFPNAISQIEHALVERRTYIVSTSVAASVPFANSCQGSGRRRDQRLSECSILRYTFQQHLRTVSEPTGQGDQPGIRNVLPRPSVL